MAAEFFNVGDYAYYDGKKVKITSESNNGLHEIEHLEAPSKGTRIRVVFSMLKRNK